jgi:hypothetical protein
MRRTTLGSFAVRARSSGVAGLLIAGLFASTVTGCSGAASEAGASMDTAAQGAFVSAGAGQWRDLSAARHVPVCWMLPPSTTVPGWVDADVRRAVQEAFEREYNGRTPVRLVGFAECTDADAEATMVRVRFETARTTARSHPGGLSWVGPVARTLPREPPWSRATMWFGAPEAWAEASPWLQNSTLRAALHEMGHALGLLHEHERSDAPECERGDPDAVEAAAATLTVGGFDAASIMNYCRDEEAPVLSEGDVEGVRFLFENAWPRIERASARTAAQGGQTLLRIAAQGMNFAPTTVATLDGTPMDTVVSSATELEASARDVTARPAESGEGSGEPDGHVFSVRTPLADGRTLTAGSTLRFTFSSR